MTGIDDIETIAERLINGEGRPGDTAIAAAWIIATTKWLKRMSERQSAAPDQPELFFSLGGGR